MSSTNRGTTRSILDYYVTPIPEIVKFLDAWERSSYPHILKEKKILDPCAGGDRIASMSYPSALERRGLTCDTVDIRQDSRAEIKQDYLKLSCKDVYDIIITNPPFYAISEIISKALTDVRPGGFVVMLLRLNYFGSQRRKEWWWFNRPSWIFIHSKRMSFTRDGKTDSIEYMHCVWTKPTNLTNLVRLEII
jgi:hypothetical protein